MLVLTRKLNEKIKIGDDVTITIIKLRNNQIRIGIEAPRDVRVLRAELEDTLGSDSSTAVSGGENSANNSKTILSRTTTKATAANQKTARTSLNNRLRPHLAETSSDLVESSELPRRNDVIDGLVSADEMIAAGEDNDDHRFDNDSLPEHDGGQSPANALQIFSGRIGTDGKLCQTSAPLAAFFTAP
jgi:carbon storage regulator CsrA